MPIIQGTCMAEYHGNFPDRKNEKGSELETADDSLVETLLVKKCLQMQIIMSSEKCVKTIKKLRKK